MRQLHSANAALHPRKTGDQIRFRLAGIKVSPFAFSTMIMKRRDLATLRAIPFRICPMAHMNFNFLFLLLIADLDFTHEPRLDNSQHFHIKFFKSHPQG